MPRSSSVVKSELDLTVPVNQCDYLDFGGLHESSTPTNSTTRDARLMRSDLFCHHLLIDLNLRV
jgi:hypothetical protein